MAEKKGEVFVTTDHATDVRTRRVVAPEDQGGAPVRGVEARVFCWPICRRAGFRSPL